MQLLKVLYQNYTQAIHERNKDTRCIIKVILCVQRVFYLQESAGPLMIPNNAEGHLSALEMCHCDL